MNFKVLTEIGHQYRDEEGTSGERFGAMLALERALKEAMVDLANAKRLRSAGVVRPALPIAPKAGMSPEREKAVTKMEEFSREFARNPAGLVAHLERTIARFRTTLTRQGCVVREDGTVVWPDSHRTVVYDTTAAAQELTRVWFEGGRLHTDERRTTWLDTRDMVTHFSGPGRAMFVVTVEGNIHVDSHKVGWRHHSSLKSGARVAMAGELGVLNGQVRWLSNKSGHYRPTARLLLQVLHLLQKNGVNMNFPVTVHNDRDYASVADFLAEHVARGNFDYQLSKLLTYHVHLNDLVLGTRTPNPWRWRTGEEATGVYDAVTNLPIPHQDVRRWLKSTGRTAAAIVMSGSDR